MMITPEMYIEGIKDLSYKQLIKERDELIRSIRKYEKLEAAGGHPDSTMSFSPSPKLIYQMDLQYLAKLCLFMQEKYNEEFVWGDKKLSDKKC